MSHTWTTNAAPGRAARDERDEIGGVEIVDDSLPLGFVPAFIHEVAWMREVRLIGRPPEPDAWEKVDFRKSHFGELLLHGFPQGRGKEFP